MSLPDFIVANALNIAEFCNRGYASYRNDKLYTAAEIQYYYYCIIIRIPSDFMIFKRTINIVMSLNYSVHVIYKYK
jgi:hypothetical protein